MGAEQADGDGLRNVEFRQGTSSACHLLTRPIDVVWSKYVLQWVKEPHLAIAEFRRVTKRAECGRLRQF